MDYIVYSHEQFHNKIEEYTDQLLNDQNEYSYVDWKAYDMVKEDMMEYTNEYPDNEQEGIEVYASVRSLSDLRYVSTVYNVVYLIVKDVPLYDLGWVMDVGLLNSLRHLHIVDCPSNEYTVLSLEGLTHFSMIDTEIPIMSVRNTENMIYYSVRLPEWSSEDPSRITIPISLYSKLRYLDVPCETLFDNLREDFQDTDIPDVWMMDLYRSIGLPSLNLEYLDLSHSTKALTDASILNLFDHITSFSTRIYGRVLSSIPSLPPLQQLSLLSIDTTDDQYFEPLPYPTRIIDLTLTSNQVHSKLYKNVNWDDMINLKRLTLTYNEETSTIIQLVPRSTQIHLLNTDIEYFMSALIDKPNMTFTFQVPTTDMSHILEDERVSTNPAIHQPMMESILEYFATPILDYIYKSN